VGKILVVLSNDWIVVLFEVVLVVVVVVTESDNKGVGGAERYTDNSVGSISGAKQTNNCCSAGDNGGVYKGVLNDKHSCCC